MCSKFLSYFQYQWGRDCLCCLKSQSQIWLCLNASANISTIWGLLQQWVSTQPPQRAALRCTTKMWTITPMGACITCGYPSWMSQGVSTVSCSSASTAACVFYNSKLNIALMSLSDKWMGFFWITSQRRNQMISKIHCNKIHVSCKKLKNIINKRKKSAPKMG